VRAPPIALLTDFGLADHYVGVVKAILAQYAPESPAIDLSHLVPPQDIRCGAFLLMAAVEYLPPETVVLAVVDPGVGTDRRALAVQAGGLTFVAPDNGLLSWALLRLARLGRCSLSIADDRLVLGEDCASVVLDQPRFWRPRVSSTFHGRDLFGPVAGHLASGISLRAVGSPNRWLRALPWPEPRPRPDGSLSARVVHVDHFGNLVTSYEGAGAEVERVEVGGQVIQGLSPYFASDQPLIALIGSSGLLEIAMPNGSAAARLGLGVGAEVRIVFRAADP